MTPGTYSATAFLIDSYPGQPEPQERHRQAEAGRVPRLDDIELAVRSGIDTFDSCYFTTRATPTAQAVATRAGIPAAQLWEALIGARDYESIWSWSDRTGLPLALVDKLTRSRRDLVLVSHWLSRPKKAALVRAAHTQIRAIISGSRAQLDFASQHLGVPRHKLHFHPWPVDDRFWRPDGRSAEDIICSVGWEARDYSTLLAAVRDVDISVELAVGTAVLALAEEAGSGRSPFRALRRTAGYRMAEGWKGEMTAGRLPPNVTVRQQMAASELRELYARARFVVVPLHDVDSDCGITTMTEAWAMGKAVIATRARGHIDIMDDGEQGLYVPPYDVAALRRAITHLLRHPDEAERMGKAGRALVEARHSLDDHVEQLTTYLWRDEDPRPRTSALSPE